MDGLGDRHVAELTERPDGRMLAVLTWDRPAVDPVDFAVEPHLVDPATGAVTHLGRTAPEAPAPTWRRGDGGWHLAYLALTPPGPIGGAAVLDGEHRNLTAGMTACPTGPAQVADGPLAAISDTRPELRGITWGAQERLAYKAPDGLELDGLLVLPAGKRPGSGVPS